MSKIVVFSDLHISIYNVEAVLNIVNQIVDYCKKNKIFTVICLGDVFDSRKAQPLLSLKLFEKILFEFYQVGIEFICIKGNHEKVDYNSNDSYLDQYYHYPGFKLYDNDELDLFERIRFHFLSFFNEEVYIENLKPDLLKNGKNYLFTHIGINGVLNNSGERVNNPIKNELFKDFDKVFSGHFHNRYENGKIIYIGSVMPTNFGEDNDKGFMILNENGSYEFVNLNFPKYEKVLIDINNFDKEQEQKLLQEYSNSGDHIRFEFMGDSSKIKSLDKTKFEVVGIDVVAKNSDIEGIVNIEEFDELIEFDENSLLSEFDEFCKINELSDKEIGLNYLKQKLNK